MKKIVTAALVFACLPAAALGGQDYDRGLEQAAIAIVAAKIGQLRGSFDVGHEPAFVTVADSAVDAAMRPGEWRHGLALASDRQEPLASRGF